MSWAQGRANWLSGRTAITWTGLFVAVLMAILAVPTLQSLVVSWQRNPDYTHGWLLFPVTVWLFVRVQPWAVNSQPMMGLGTMTILAGGMVHLAAQIVPWPLLDYPGWFLLIRGLALSLWGRDAAHRLLPVLAFGVLLFPLPTSWLNDLAMLLQNLIAQAAEWGLSLFWVCHRRGHLLELAGLDEPLSVAVECSGVRQLMVFVAIAWCMAFFLNGAWWRQGLLVLASVPLAIVANVLRVFVLAICAKVLGLASIQGVLHDVPLLLTLPLGGLMLWWCYCRLDGNQAVTISSGHNLRLGRSLALPVAALVLLITLQIGLQIHLQNSGTTPRVTHFSFDDLPWQLGNWRGQPHPDTAKVTQQADFADAVAVRAYSDKEGRAAAVYLVFSASGRDRLHHPEICLRDAGGAIELKGDRQSIPLQAGTNRSVERFRYQRQRHERTVVYYWHYTMMPPVTEEQSLLQRLYLQQNYEWPGITVQVQTSMTDPGAWKAIEASLLPEIDRWLQTQLPVGTQVGSSRLPVRFTFDR